MGRLQQLGGTRQRLLRHLLQQPSGAGVEALCERLRVSHNAVRQHLAELIGHGWVQRPQVRLQLTPQSRELFPRNYAQISSALLEEMTRRLGATEVSALLVSLGSRLGAGHADRPDGADVATHLAAQLDQLGCEA